MKKSLPLTIASIALIIASSSASAFWGNNNWGNNGYNYNPYDPWDPRFWMEEMENFWDNDSYGGGPWNNGGWNNGPWNNMPFNNGGWNNGGWNNGPWNNMPFNNGGWNNGNYGGPSYGYPGNAPYNFTPPATAQ